MLHTCGGLTQDLLIDAVSSMMQAFHHIAGALRSVLYRDLHWQYPAPFLLLKLSHFIFYILSVSLSARLQL